MESKLNQCYVRIDADGNGLTVFPVAANFSLIIFHVMDRLRRLFWLISESEPIAGACSYIYPGFSADRFFQRVVHMVSICIYFRTH